MAAGYSSLGLRFISIYISFYLIYVVSSTKISIGVLYDDSPTLLRAVQQSLASAASDDHALNFSVVSERVDPKDSYQVAKSASRLLKKNVSVLLVPSTTGGYSVLPALSSNVHVPLISLSERNLRHEEQNNFLLNFEPDTLKAILDVLRFYQWDSVVYFYNKDDGPDRIRFLTEQGFGQHYSKVTSLNKVKRADTGADILRTLELRNGKLTVLLDLEAELTEELLNAYSRGAQNKAEHHFILMSPMDDTFWKKNKDQRQPLKISGFQIYDPKSPETSRALKSIAKADTSKTRTLLAMDASQIIEEGLTRLAQNKPTVLDQVLGFFSNASSKLQPGEDIRESLLQTTIHEGVTGPVQFDSQGKRSSYTLFVMESTSQGVKEVFTWTDHIGLTATGASTAAPKNILTGKKFKVTTLISEPYTMLSKGPSGADVYTGYCKDLMDLLAAELEFEYDMVLVKDGRYGSKIVGGGDGWNGMIGEIVRNEADIACSDLTITTMRSAFVDFTAPFQYAGISLMIKRPHVSPSLGPGSSDYFFFRVFTAEAWGCLVATLVASGLIYFGVSKLTALTIDPTTGQRTTVGLLSSWWFTFGALMLRGVDKQPGSISSRVLTAVWWLFVSFSLIVYLGGLTSMLLAHQFGSPELDFQEKIATQSIDDFLQEALEHGSPQVGLILGGSTGAYYKSSASPVHHRYASYLDSHPELATSSYSEGVERVQTGNGKYAFLMDSTSNEYYTHRLCEDVAMLSRLHDQKGFGLAFSKNSLYRDQVQTALLALSEKSELVRLHHKWWKANSTCSSQEPNYRDLYHTSMTLQDIGGLFYCLVVGVILTFFVTAAEYCIERRKRPEVSLTRMNRNDQEQDERSFL